MEPQLHSIRVICRNCSSTRETYWTAPGDIDTHPLLAAPMTEAEKAVLRDELQLYPAEKFLMVYRAGKRDGAPHVIGPNSGEPGLEVTAVLDCDGDLWLRDGDDAWRMASSQRTASWETLNEYYPLLTFRGGVAALLAWDGGRSGG